MSTQHVAVDDVTVHPDNPRVGDVDAIVESLKAHGQYRPIVVSGRTNRVLAGNHTLKAVRRLGWDEVAAVFVDVDEDGERRILLADNRTADLASYNLDALTATLGSLPDLDGTGFTADDLLSLEADLKRTASEPLGDDDDDPLDEMEEQRKAQVRLGPYRLDVEDDAWIAWTQENTTGDRIADKAAYAAALRIPVKQAKVAPDDVPARLVSESEPVPPDTLAMWPDNPRDGDIGAIAESLIENGQYRPIVVNRRDRVVLVGNHTLAAVRALGWDKIDVTWVDVDEDDARKIVLVDNRTADLAFYNETALLAVLRSLDNLAGTAWDDDDADGIRFDERGRPRITPQRGKRLAVGEVRWLVNAEQWAGFLDTLPMPDDVDVASVEIGERLQLPPDSWRLGL